MAGQNRACSTARAWMLGTRLARLLTAHDVPRAAQVETRNYNTRDGQGQTDLTAEMATAGDLFRLANRADVRLTGCDAAGGDAQAFATFGEPRNRFTAYYVAPLSTSERVA